MRIYSLVALLGMLLLLSSLVTLGGCATPPKVKKPGCQCYECSCLECRCGGAP